MCTCTYILICFENKNRLSHNRYVLNCNYYGGHKLSFCSLDQYIAYVYAYVYAFAHGRSGTGTFTYG